MIDLISGKKVRIGVAFMRRVGTTTTNYYEGIVKTCMTLGSEAFIVFDNNSAINVKYVQTIEIIG